MMMPPPRGTSRQTHASLRASALRSSLVAAPPTPSICSRSGPSRTSTILPRRRSRLARPWASVDLPEPLIPVNQTVNPVVAMVPRIMEPRSPCESWRRIPTSPHSGKEYAGSISIARYSGKSRNPTHFVFVEIATRRIPRVEAGAIDRPAAHRDDEVAYARPEGLLPAAQGHVPVFAGEIGANIGVRMDD